MLLKIGELAKRAGLTVRTLHHYDHIGLLSPTARSGSGFRLYDQTDVERLHKIQALKQFGCSLSEIGEFLEKPEGSPIGIITRQMSVLDEQVLQAQALRDRLARLRERISNGEDTGLNDWLRILELMTMYEKHFSKEELDTLRSNQAAGNLDDEWRRLIVLVRDSIERGTPSESEEARGLALRWMGLLRHTTGNDPELAMKLYLIHREEAAAPLYSGVDPEMIGYIAQALANAKLAILAKYLSPGEVESVRARRAEHESDWPPLVAEVRRRMEQGAAPDDPAVQNLARRWVGLFRESYSGGDPTLGDKIWSAFKNEPDLRIGVGVDPASIAFMERAIAHLRVAQGGGENRPGLAPKLSALRVAMLRAVHQVLDNPLIFEDPLAFSILSATEQASLRGNPSRFDTPLARAIRTSVAVRSRLAEDEWGESKRRGVRQYVILGAGLDTFAYRNPDGDRVRVFEVDLPATQAWKRERLRAAGIVEPASLSFVPTDFEGSTLAEALGGAGLRRDAPAFFSWLGVTMYLEEEAIMDALGFIASLAKGSGVVFDYGVHSSLLGPRERKALEYLTARTSEHGEPWKTLFDPTKLIGMLRSLEFGKVRDFGPEQLNERYLAGRKDGLHKSGVSRMVWAEV